MQCAPFLSINLPQSKQCQYIKTFSPAALPGLHRNPAKMMWAHPILRQDDNFLAVGEHGFSASVH